MNKVTRKTSVIDAQDSAHITAQITSLKKPAIVKGLVKNWPLVQAGLTSDETAVNYLKEHYNGKSAGVYFGEPNIEGRFAYNESVTKLNFEVRKTQLDEMLDTIQCYRNEQMPPSIYIASNSIDHYFPTLRSDNDVIFDSDVFAPLDLKDAALLASIWIGNKTLVSCHFDAQKNIACCVVGRRRFTLFPPDQIANLYPGPLTPTPGGQVISMVDFKAPDLNKYPRFSRAIEAGQIAELEPGDALFLPSMWWHQVEGLSPFNVLINYWWDTSPRYLGQATDALTHALLSIKSCPPEERQAWKAIFDYYIFGESNRSSEHLPEASHGALGEVDTLIARRLRGQLINKLNR